MSDQMKINKEAVAEFLKNNPDFFNLFPDVLEHINLNHGSGVATSLIERQVEQLRESKEQTEQQLTRLLQVATENEELMSRLHALTLELMSTTGTTEFFTSLSRALMDDFNADFLSISLYKPFAPEAAAENVKVLNPEEERLEAFRTHLDKNQSVCGRLANKKLTVLFGDQASQVESSALVPLGNKGKLGLMAIGSSDPSRFYPGMGTLFLDLLADVIATYLDRDTAVEPEQEQLRSA